jgi:hypothetical protein
VQRVRDRGGKTQQEATNVRSMAGILLRLGAICAAVLGLAAHYAWGEVLTDRVGRFSADFPGRPETSTQRVETQAGAVIAHIFTYRSMGGTTYTVVYSDYPDGSMANTPPDSVYSGVINGAMGRTGGTLKGTNAVTSDSVPGREALFVSPDQKNVLRSRYFLVGDRLYQIGFEGSQGSETGKGAVGFLDSFRILK